MRSRFFPLPGLLAILLTASVAQGTPVSEASNFLKLLRDGDAEAAWRRTADVFQNSTTLDQFREVIAGRDGLRQYASLRITEDTLNDGISTLTLELSDKTGVLGSVRMQLRQAGKGWQVSAVDFAQIPLADTPTANTGSRPGPAPGYRRQAFKRHGFEFDFPEEWEVLDDNDHYGFAPKIEGDSPENVWAEIWAKPRKPSDTFEEWKERLKKVSDRYPGARVIQEWTDDIPNLEEKPYGILFRYPGQHGEPDKMARMMAMSGDFYFYELSFHSNATEFAVHDQTFSYMIQNFGAAFDPNRPDVRNVATDAPPRPDSTGEAPLAPRRPGLLRRNSAGSDHAKPAGKPSVGEIRVGRSRDAEGRLLGVGRAVPSDSPQISADVEMIDHPRGSRIRFWLEHVDSGDATEAIEGSLEGEGTATIPFKIERSGKDWPVGRYKFVVVLGDNLRFEQGFEVD